MLVDKLRPIVARSEEIEALLADSDLMSDVSLLAALSKERSDNEEVFRKSKEYLKVLDDISHSRSLLNDRELGELAKEELKWLELSKRSLEEEINVLLIPKDPNDGKNIFLEIRAGVGGDEACIFVGDLFGAYCRYADSKGWRVEIISSNENSLGGYKEIIVSIQGDRVYSKLKFESGTHRVQRVPKTESQGRVHTSAVTVAIMPEADDVEVSLSPSDVKVDVFRSGGHGGQSVNTTDSAVRVTHVPTGIAVCIQDEKSQHKNKEKAMRILRSKLYELEIDAQNRENDRNRKLQVGSGDRSERVRTYNYPQNRLTDHRINLTIYSLEEVMLSGDLDKMVLPLIASFHSSALAK